MLMIAQLVIGLVFTAVELCDFLFQHLSAILLLYMLFSKRAAKC